MSVPDVHNIYQVDFFFFFFFGGFIDGECEATSRGALHKFQTLQILIHFLYKWVILILGFN